MKNRTYAILWAFFLGHFGAHKFYLNQPGRGILYAIFFWTGIPSILALIAVVHFLIMGESGFNDRYNA